jgi:ketosteroid isomerase-like protein
MPMDQQRAQHFAEQRYAAWNAHDLTAILDHYADDVEMVSPLVSALTGSHRAPHRAVASAYEWLEVR